jgi:GT2 family glycosyltransferase
MNAPSVHIVTLNWNGLDDTLDCLRSIEKLTYENVTTIVVDNGSSNHEADRIRQEFPNTVVLAQVENLGFCGGCNAGIRYALDNGADYVMLLNNDTLVVPELVEHLVSGFEKLPTAGAASPLILETPAETVWFSRARWIENEAKFRLADPGETIDDLRSLEPYETDFACGCCVMVPADIFKREGLLDERFFAFYDEAEWCYRVRRNGLASYVIPSALIYHKVSRSTPTLVSTYLLTRNRLLWMKENLSLRERMRSWRYLMKEFIWHLANTRNLTRSTTYSKAHSRAVLLGYKDYFLKRFGKWDKSAEALLFS